MEHYKRSKLLNDSNVSKFAPRKWIEVNDISVCQYSVDKNITFESPMLRSNLCDYNDLYIVVKKRIAVEGTSTDNQTNKKLPLRIILRLDHTYQKSMS